MTLALCFIVCDHLFPEMEAAVTAEGLSEVEVRSFPARCGQPPLSRQEMVEYGKGSDADFVELFGCHCLSQPTSTAPAPEFLHCKINRQEQCFHLLCGQTLVNTLQQNGTYLLTPGWLVHWQQHIADWGFDRPTARNFFGESLNSLLLLDTGVDENAGQHLTKFASFLDLPCNTLEIGLDFHRLALAKIVTGYRQQEVERQKETALRDAADLAMTMDLLGQVTGASSETKVIDAIVELFTMLLAPEKIIYVRVRKRRMQLEQIVDLTSVNQQQLENFHAQPKKKYQLNTAGDSFLLRMGRGDKVSAILHVCTVAFPQYIEAYLNVALHVSGICALAIEHARTMEKLFDTSRLAGKAEVATEVLHNVGNTLNSISVSSERIREMTQKSSSRTLPGIVKLIEQHSHDPGTFFADDPRGKKLPLYFARLSEQLTDEQQQLQEEASRQHKHIRRVAEIIRTQQDAAKGEGLREQVQLSSIIEESLQIFEQQIKEKQVQVQRDYARLPLMIGERHKILQVVNNLISNALDSFDDTEQKVRRVLLGLYPAADDTGNDKNVILEVADNGKGMDSSTLEQIFVFGFTTKKDGHGFGLHNAANLTAEMGGSLTATSPGKGQGATFRMHLPVPEQTGELNGRK